VPESRLLVVLFTDLVEPTETVERGVSAGLALRC
jgi:hypothetical protein